MERLALYINSACMSRSILEIVYTSYMANLLRIAKINSYGDKNISSELHHLLAGPSAQRYMGRVRQTIAIS